MRVTEFRDYLACPYRYYLRHVLGLKGLTDSAAELDGAAFGSLAHEVLARLGTVPPAAATDAEAVRRQLDELLDKTVLERYRQDAARRRSASRSSSSACGCGPLPGGRPIGLPRAGGSSTWRPDPDGREGRDRCRRPADVPPRPHRPHRP